MAKINYDIVYVTCNQSSQKSALNVSLIPSNANNKEATNRAGTIVQVLVMTQMHLANSTKI